MSGLTESLASFVAETPGSAIPAQGRANAIDTIVDVCATTWAGLSEPASLAIRQATIPSAGPGRAVIAGELVTVDAAAAALCNGAAAHALDYDTINFAVSGFVGSPMLAALAALADERGKTGAEVVTAYCLGWEAAAALGRALNPEHYALGWHPTSTLGHLAATFAACRLVGLDPTRTTSALAAAVSEVSGVKIMIGNMINAYHVGKAARNAVTAVRLAEAGFDGHPDPLEAEQGFLRLFAGPSGADPVAAGDSLGRVWDLVEPGPVWKVHACCGLIHSGLDAVAAIVEDEGVVPSEVVGIQVRVHEYVPKVMHIARPQTGYAAKFCIPYCVAAALRDGRAGLAAFEQVDAELVALGELVEVAVHPDLHGGDTFFEKEFTEVRVITKRGVFDRRVHRLHNRGSGRISEELLEGKFSECLSRGGSRAPDAKLELARLRAIDSSGHWETWTT